jgi:hypothetical protein
LISIIFCLFKFKLNNGEKVKKIKDEEIKSLKDELNSIKKQNENLKSVYDGLLIEYAKVEAALEKYEKPNESKKSY